MSPSPRSRPPSDFRLILRRELPRLLREDAAFRNEVRAVLEEILPFPALIAELRGLREDFNRFAEQASQRFEAMDRRFAAMEGRFEAIDRRFAAMDRRFDAVIIRLDRHELHLSRLSGRLGRGLEHLVRGVVEEFAGRPVTRAERLLLRDPDGEVFGVPADVEFDLLASDGEAYLCEVKSHIEPDDVLIFHRKAAFAARHLERPFVRLMIGASMEARADTLMQSLGIRSIVRARIERD